MDNETQILLQRSKELNHEGIMQRKAGNYSSAVDYFTQAISLFPREEYFYNRALSRLATSQGVSYASYSSDDMLVALLIGYLEHHDEVGQAELVQSLVYYLEKMMQINLLGEDILLHNLNEKNAYRNYILAEKFAEFVNSVNDPASVYREEYLYFRMPTFEESFKDYFSRFAIGPFNMMLDDQTRANWTRKSLSDVRQYLNNEQLINAANNICALLFN
ncbi:hypothetical protein [Limosilactobacillus fastidiosus]|uniref:Tetratricopeptide repeat protein n=1 Tax=Limosilactobacillus fastidiosus TaxID=2759855 RepID=A0ABR6E7W8_9LACO|nr:hypothetical protein [Limosilactobacillus fastidiosus]MBB1063293.1 hypothetical protein [Limosilactobacillus fastidiosus]MCD7084603.1 hypothetical protein [Limosilactobacillus fastidiosus]